MLFLLKGTFQFGALLAYSATTTAITPIGCWTDSVSRALQGPSTSSGAMTTEYCASFCSSYPLFGTEYSSQCFCGSVLLSGAAMTDTSVGCKMPCAGNSIELCGGPYVMNLYVH